ncbi:hypothetical protein [Williamsia sp.]|uniref:hypothetical protein n=1 Tax=Williamsia sp. TaxID=1872085 RepID=UPI002F9373C0
MFFDPFVAMEHIYDNDLKMTGDPAFADIDDDTKLALFDLVVFSPEAQKAAEVTTH